MSSPDGWDLPFEASDGGELHAPDAVLAGGLVVLATVVDAPDLGPHPGLVFRFTGPGGTMTIQPILLLLDDEHMQHAAGLVAEAARAAIDAARQARRV